MKLLKNSFAVIIAVVAVGLTLASYGGVFTNTEVVKVVKKSMQSDCFSSIQVSTSLANCNATTPFVIDVQNCPGTTLNGRGLTAATAPVDPSEACQPDEEVLFCCAIIQTGGNCPAFNPEGSLPLGQYRVASVECKGESAK